VTRSTISSAVSKMPTHDSFIDQHCRA